MRAPDIERLDTLYLKARERLDGIDNEAPADGSSLDLVVADRRLWLSLAVLALGLEAYIFGQEAYHGEQGSLLAALLAFTAVIGFPVGAIALFDKLEPLFYNDKQDADLDIDLADEPGTKDRP